MDIFVGILWCSRPTPPRKQIESTPKKPGPPKPSQLAQPWIGSPGNGWMSPLDPSRTKATRRPMAVAGSWRWNRWALGTNPLRVFQKLCGKSMTGENTHTHTHLQAHRKHLYTQSATGFRVDQRCRCSMRCEMKIHWTSLNRTYFWNQSLILATWVSLSLILGIGAVRSSIYFEFRLMNRSKHNLFTVGLPLQSEQAVPICAFPFNNHWGGKWVSLQHLLPLWYNSLTHFEAHQPYLGSFSMFNKKHGETEI